MYLAKYHVHTLIYASHVNILAGLGPGTWLVFCLNSKLMNVTGVAYDQNCKVKLPTQLL